MRLRNPLPYEVQVRSLGLTCPTGGEVEVSEEVAWSLLASGWIAADDDTRRMDAKIRAQLARESETSTAAWVVLGIKCGSCHRIWKGLAVPVESCDSIEAAMATGTWVSLPYGRCECSWSEEPRLGTADMRSALRRALRVIRTEPAPIGRRHAVTVLVQPPVSE